MKHIQEETHVQKHTCRPKTNRQRENTQTIGPTLLKQTREKYSAQSRLEWRVRAISASPTPSNA